MNYRGKKILVTGGTGSIGRQLVLKLLIEGADIAVLSRTENKHNELNNWLKGKDLRFSVKHIIGDIRNYDVVAEASDDCRIIFHCAAMKYVGLCEENPYEAIQTNLVGAQNIRNACFANRVDHLIVTGTDKSANPKGVMGLTKHLQERVFLTPDMTKTRVAITRFGNVIGSEGSVVWKFKEDFEAGRPLTVTYPLMTRYIITPVQAADILLWTCSNANDRSIVSMVMPMCFTKTLAQAVCDNDNINWQSVGTKQGEKLFEDLFSLEESHKKIRVIDSPIGRMLVYNDRYNESVEEVQVEKQTLADRHQVRQILRDAGVVE